MGIGSSVRRWTLSARILLVVLIATGLNLALDAVIVAFGGRAGTLTDLAYRYQDFFHFALSFPPDGPVAAASIESGRVASAIEQDLYTRSAPGSITNLHVPPFTATLAIAASAAMRSVDPSLLFFGLLLALVGWWIALVRRFAPTGERGALIALGIVAYPMLQMANRGNLFAGLTALLLITAMLLSAHRRAPVLAGTMVALAMCIRPNSLVFVVPLLLLQPRWRSAAGALIVVWGVVTIGTYAIAHTVYPRYSVASMLDALQLYHAKYVVENAGLGYGSSFLGGLKLAFYRYHPALEVIGALTGLAIIGTAIVLHIVRPLTPVLLLFLTLAGYALGSAVFADYHLMAFLIIPLIVARGPMGRSTLVAVIATTAMLLPKSIYLRNFVTTQAGLNPLILLLAVLAVLALEAHARLRQGQPVVQTG